MLTFANKIMWNEQHCANIKLVECQLGLEETCVEIEDWQIYFAKLPQLCTKGKYSFVCIFWISDVFYFTPLCNLANVKSLACLQQNIYVAEQWHKITSIEVLIHFLIAQKMPDYNFPYGQPQRRSRDVLLVMGC